MCLTLCLSAVENFRSISGLSLFPIDFLSPFFANREQSSRHRMTNAFVDSNTMT